MLKSSDASDASRRYVGQEATSPGRSDFGWRRQCIKIPHKAGLDHHESSPQIYDMPGVVSRTKQLFPYLSSLVSKLTPP